MYIKLKMRNLPYQTPNHSKKINIYQHKNRKVNQQERTEDPKIDPSKHKI